MEAVAVRQLPHGAGLPRVRTLPDRARGERRLRVVLDPVQARMPGGAQDRRLMERGTCHICQLVTEIGWCGLCGHWFCEACRDAWFARGLEWVKELVGGRRDGCCGPGAEPPPALRGDLR